MPAQIPAPPMRHRAVAIQGYFLSPGRASIASMQATQRTVQSKGALHLQPGREAFPVELRQKSGGWPLPKDVKAKMESALGADFSDVRVHVGPEASSIGAIAFTWGSDIHFAPGQYNPHTPQGQFLLGHELTHVVQQRAGRVSNPFGSGVAVVQDHALEAEADRLGHQAASVVLPKAASSSGRAAAPQPKNVVNRKHAPAPRYAVHAATPRGSGWLISASASGKGDQVGSVQLTPSEQGVYISDLKVDPEHRRHGLAKQLMQAAMHTARSHGYQVAQLEARPDSIADVAPGALVSMYQRLGFRNKGVTKRGAPLMERST